jgi:hypothetical protein
MVPHLTPAPICEAQPFHVRSPSITTTATGQGATVTPNSKQRLKETPLGLFYTLKVVPFIQVKPLTIK